MELSTLIRSRRSVGAFTDKPVDIGLVQNLLESAVYAPNHRLTEPWRFIILTDKAVQQYASIRRDMVLDSMKSQGEAEREQAAIGTYRKFANVPLYLLVVMQSNPNPEIYEEDYAACSCLIQNFLLLAWDKGLGTCWKTFKNDSRLRQFLCLTPSEKVIGIIHVGYSAETGLTSTRQPVQDRLTILGETV